MAIKLDIEKVDIPIHFGDVTIGFVPSEENILQLSHLLSDENSKLSTLRDTAKALEDLNEEEVTPAKLAEIVTLAKETAAELFNNFFGDGAFNKVYEVYPSIEVLLSGFIQIATQIPDEVESYKKRIQVAQERKIAKYKRK